MKVAIFTGGTGSIALQTGIHQMYGDNADYYVITNAYDNGKSTGAVRTVYDGKILGPSDVRKNQTLRHKLMWCKDKKMTSMYQLLDHRFDVETQDAELYCLQYVSKKLKETITTEYAPPEETEKTFVYAIKHYFRQPKALQIPYVDFSLANIIYAGLAAQNNFSLEKAATIMSHILQIPDNVILNSDESLFLGAVTRSGHVITDEGEIVEWENPSDIITDITLVDENGEAKLPIFSERAKKITLEADLIILSSGTLWSSLIPTYASQNFDMSIHSSKAFFNGAIYVVINNMQDKDMYGVNAYAHIKLISSYVSSSPKIKYIVNKQAADNEMKPTNIPKGTHFDIILADMGKGKTHDPLALVRTIFGNYFWKYIRNKIVLFDYDDTVVGRNSTYKKTSEYNKAYLWAISGMRKVSIITGNSMRAVNLIPQETESLPTTNDLIANGITISIYADGGVNYHTINFGSIGARKNIIDKGCIDLSILYSNKQVLEIIEKLEHLGIKSSKIQNRNNATISIKPIEDEYRKPLVELFKLMLSTVVEGEELFIRPTGRTTIDISKNSNNKVSTLNFILKDCDKNTRVTMVGDEASIGGNDHEISVDSRVDFYEVTSPKDTYVFLKTLFDIGGSQKWSYLV